MNSKPKTVLIITASGGAGLLQAAKAEEQRLLKENPNTKIIKRDLMLQWLGKLIGNFGVSAWNKAQKAGNVTSQEILVSFQSLAEILCWPHLFYNVLKTLIKEDVDQIIDTQPIGTSAIIKAVRFYNRKYKKNVKVKMLIVDLPTKKNTHFLGGIKRLSKSDHKFIYIHTIRPLLEKNQTEAKFWKKYCNITEENIVYDDSFIRDSFKKYSHKIRPKDAYYLNIKTANENEADLIQQIFKQGSIQASKENANFQFKVNEKDFVISVVLGSQPSFKATLNYAKSLIKIMKEKQDITKNVYLFAFCSKNEEGLFQKFLYMVLNTANYPKNLSIIPISYQQEEEIASLFFRSDITITRSGGQTAMELMCLSTGLVCVHSEYKNKKRPTLKKLLKGIPAWEAGNACYLKEKHNAKIVTPMIFYDLCRDLIVD